MVQHHHIDNGGIIPHIPTPSLSASRRVQQRQPFPSHQYVSLSNQQITALNQLGASFRPSSDDTNASCSSIFPSSLTSATADTIAPSYVKPLPSSSSHRVHRVVYSSSQRYCRHLSNDHQSLSSCGDRRVHVTSSLFNSIDRFIHHLPSQSAMNSSYTSPPPVKLIIAANVSLPKTAISWQQHSSSMYKL